MTGRFIVFEGIDGSGTTTQARRMCDALVEARVPVHLTQEPSYGPIGSLIRQFLQRRLVSLGPSGPRKPGWETMGLLFAADRLDHLESEILPNLGDGITVITDRYLYSSLVYQSVTADAPDAREWLASLNRSARMPDVVFYLVVHPEEAGRRRMERSTMVEMYEDADLQERIAEQYEGLLSGLDGVRIFMIDGSMSERDVHAACMERLGELERP